MICLAICIRKAICAHILKFCSAFGSKICSVNLDREATFLTLPAAVTKFTLALWHCMERNELKILLAQTPPPKKKTLQMFPGMMMMMMIWALGRRNKAVIWRP